MLALALLAGVLTVVALRAEGHRAVRTDLDGGAVWVSGDAVDVAGETRERVGRINTQTPEIEAVVEPSGAVEILQSGDRVLIAAGGRLLGVTRDDDSIGPARRLPSDGVRVAFGGGIAAILDTSNGALWLDDPDVLVDAAADTRADARVEEESLLVVTSSGTAITHRPGDTTVQRVEPDGSVATMDLIRASTGADPVGSGSTGGLDASVSVGPVQLTAAGETPVILDREAAAVLVGDADAVGLPDDATGAALSRPHSGDAVVVASDLGLHQVEDGRVIALLEPADGRGGGLPPGATDAVRPVVVGGCVHAAWRVDAGIHLVRTCPDRPSADAAETIALAGTMSTANRLVFRTDGARAVLNDRDSGTSWIFDGDGTLHRIDDWGEVDRTEEPEEDDRTVLREPETDLDCDDDLTVAPAIEPLRFGSRAGTPTLIPVFADAASVTASPCSVLAVTSASAGSGRVDITAAADTVQYTADGDSATDEIELTVDDGRGGVAEATILIDVHPVEADGNEAPVVPEGNATAVVAGGTVSHDVLVDVIDPEGDPVILVDACAGTGGTSCLDAPPAGRDSRHGTVVHGSDGMLHYDAPGGIGGSRVIAFAVQDVHGAFARGTLTVRVLAPDDPDIAPVAHADHLRLTGGDGGRLDPTANDVSPAGRPLIVTDLNPVAAPEGVSTTTVRDALALDPDTGEVTIAAGLPEGAYLLRYRVGDGGEPVPGLIRVDVVDEPDRRPVAIRDDAVLHGKRPLHVDLLANDVDPGGGVLVVQSIENPGADDTGPQVQLLGDLRTARITAPTGFEVGSRPILARYSVSNGVGHATGVVVIRPHPHPGVQSPLARPDGPVTVAPGGLVSIPVVDNDLSPQGGPLRVVEVDDVDPDAGTAFVGANEVRFLAAEGDGVPGVTTLRYVVEDDDRNRASGRIEVHVVDPDGPDRPPVPLELSARVLTGRSVEVEVPLLAADPEGGVVGITAIGRGPERGDVEITASGLRYTAGDDPDRDVGTQEIRFTLGDGVNHSESILRVGVAPPPFDRMAPAVTPIPITVATGQRRVVDVLDPLHVSSSSDLHIVTTGDDAPIPPRPGTGSIDVDAEAGTIAYTAPDDLGGEELLTTSFAYTVADDDGRRAANRVTVTVRTEAEEAPPIAGDDFVLPTRPGREVEIDLLANDLDPNTGDSRGLGAELVSAPSDPEDLRLNAGTATFEMPDRAVRFRYRVTSASSGATAQGVVSIPVDRGVTCDAHRFEVAAGSSTTVDVLSACSGPPGSELVLLDATVDEAVGTAEIVDQELRFRAMDISSGAHPLEVRVCVEGPSCPDTTTIIRLTVIVTGSNEPPIMRPVTVHVPAGDTTTTNLRRHLVDPNPGDRERIRFRPETFRLVDGRVEAEIDAAGTLEVRATSDAHRGGRGRGDIEVGFDDGHELGVGSGTVTIVVDPSKAPGVIANDDLARVVVGRSPSHRIPVLDNDLNPSSDGRARLEVGAITQPSGTDDRRAGRAEIAASADAVTFTPAAGFGGITSFTYTAVDPSDTSRRDRATVTLAVVGRPGLAGTPTGDGRRSGEIPLRWAAADGNGGPVLTYELECRMADGGSCPRGVPDRVGSTSTTVTGLRNGVAHRFRVRAVNEAGASRSGSDDGWSAWSEPIIPDAIPEITSLRIGDFSRPDPEGPSLPDGVGGQLTIRWDARVDGSAITAYLVTVDGVTRTIHAGSPEFLDRAVVWGGLANNRTVTVSVTARNSAGDAEPWRGTGRPDAPPGPATVLDTASGDRSVTIRWTWSPATGESGPDRFRIRGSDGSIRTVGAVRGTDGSWSTTIDLPNGLDVRFRIRGHNAAGWGPWGPESEPVRAVGRPSSPRGVLSDSDRSGHVRLTVTAPADDGGSPITRYRLRTTGRDLSFAAPAGTVHLDGFTDGLPVAGGTLVACSDYRGIERCSDPGDVGGTATPFAAPGPPTDVTGTIEGDRVRWSWTSPSPPAGATGMHHRVTGSGLTAGDVSETAITTGDLGCSARTATLTVRAVSRRGGLEQIGPAVTAEIDLPDTCPSLRIDRAGPVPDGTGGCSGPDCRTVVAVHRHFPPGTWTIHCRRPDGTLFADADGPLETTLHIESDSGDGSLPTACAAAPGTLLTLVAAAGSTIVESPLAPLP